MPRVRERAEDLATLRVVAPVRQKRERHEEVVHGDGALGDVPILAGAGRLVRQRVEIAGIAAGERVDDELLFDGLAQQPAPLLLDEGLHLAGGVEARLRRLAPERRDEELEVSP